MTREMRRVFSVFSVLLGFFAAGAWAIDLEHGARAAYWYGIALFVGNLWLLFVISRGLFAAAAGGSSRRSGGLALLFSLKTLFLGFGAYLGIVVFGFSPLWFVGGMGAGLAAITLASLARPKTA